MTSYSLPEEPESVYLSKALFSRKNFDDVEAVEVDGEDGQL